MQTNEHNFIRWFGTLHFNAIQANVVTNGKWQLESIHFVHGQT